MRSSKAVVAGNDYLAARARSAGAKRVEILPTVVDTERYTFAPMPANETLTIGWIGSPITTRYLEQFRPTIAKMCEGGRARFVAIGASALDWPDVPVEVRPWSETSEVAELHGFDVGIMPLPDSPWERGKCGFKLIQYMACGRPVIGSPVGVNSQIIEDGVNGFLASTDRDWLAAVERLREEKGLRRDMGANGRQLVESQYSTQVIGPRLVEILTSVARNAS
jgi:glycosyltransferase involved in cell wall biosynthesis